MKQLILLTLLCTPFLSLSQLKNFALNGNIQYLPKERTIFINERDGSTLLLLNDSILIQQQGVFTSTTEKNYDPKIGFEINASFDLTTWEKLSLKSGIGLSFTTFDFSSDLLDSSFELISSDTINSIPGPQIGLSFCDEFTNSSQSFGEIKSELTQQIIHLKIPLVLSYELLEDKLFIQLGGFIQTPLLSQLSREYLTIHQEQENGQTICEFQKVEEEDTSGKFLNNFQVGGGISAAYRFFDNFYFELGASKLFNNVFVEAEFQTFPFDNEAFQPTRFFAGFQYRFQKKEN